MTYIDYMNQLWRSSDKVPMPASEIALYTYLVNLCNLQYWKMPVICSTLMICEKLHLSKQTVNTIRKDLADRGLISYDEGKSRFVPSKYYLLKLTDGLTHIIFVITKFCLIFFIFSINVTNICGFILFIMKKMRKYIIVISSALIIS